MRYQYNFLGLLIIFFMAAVSPPVNAQDPVPLPESVYDSIRIIAFSGRLGEAELMARDLVNQNREYGDAVVLLARIIAWQERYSEAIELLDSLLISQPQHEDAKMARIEIEKWMTDASGGEAASGDSIIFAVLPRDTTIVDPVDKDVQKADNNKVRGVDLHLGYSFDTFEDPYYRFWQIFSLGAMYKTKAGPVMGTVNFGNLHADSSPWVVETGIQFQAEMWPVISERSYGWVAYAYSPFAYFPSHRASAEYWYNLQKGWVVSAGASYYYFDMNIFIPAFSVEKYVGKYWFSAKSYIYLKDAGTTASLYLTARRYSNDHNYFQLTVGAGTAPDEPYDIAADLDRQQAVAVKLAVNRYINHDLSVKAGAGYSREEYQDGLRRNRFEGFIILIFSRTRK